MQGSGVIDGKVYGFQGTTGNHQAACDYKPSRRVRFHEDPNKYGTGVMNLPLTPYKSIAVDKRVIPYGSKIYIPSAVGTEYKFEGKTLVHDGIFFAQDTGGLIKGNHIDVYIGPVEGGLKAAINANPFDFVKSNEDSIFEAYILKE